MDIIKQTMQMFHWGLALFFGVHLVPLIPSMRARLAQGMGEPAYKGAFSLFSIGGIVLISIGYPSARDMLFMPPSWAAVLAQPVIFVAFVLFVAAQLPTYIRKTTRHPMSLGVVLWSGMHLLASPNRTSLWLFVLFFLFALISAISAEQRGKVKADVIPRLRLDMLAIVLGGAAYTLAYYIHFL